MSKIQIFSEGKEDIKFLKDLSSNLSRKTDSVIYEWTDGWTNLHLVKAKFLENTNKGGLNLVIFDTDENYQQRHEAILAKKAQLGINFELFLMPNCQDPGNLETLLLGIANPTHEGIFQCFDTFKTCLTTSDANLRLPDDKAKIFSYLECLNLETHSEKRDFLNPYSWRLYMPILNPLKAFLNLHLPPL
jgi:hypothetical protein